jgi:adenylate kinase
VVLGPPASGKGTQGRRLAESLGLGYLSTGALLREEVEKQSELGCLAEPILARGHYLPDDLMCRILADWLERQTQGWLLDGFPRSVPQAGFLDGWLTEHRMALDAAVSLEVPFEILLGRIGGRVECPECRWSGQTEQTKESNACPVCGHPVSSRPDDSVANFTERHAEFERLTRPVIDFYQERDLLFHCNATKPQDDVAAILLQHFSPRPGDSFVLDS